MTRFRTGAVTLATPEDTQAFGRALATLLRAGDLQGIPWLGLLETSAHHRALVKATV